MEAFTPPSPPRGPQRQISDINNFDQRFRLSSQSPPLSPSPLSNLLSRSVNSQYSRNISSAQSPPSYNNYHVNEFSRPPSLPSLSSLSGSSDDLFGFLNDRYPISPILSSSSLSHSAAVFSSQAMSMPFMTMKTKSPEHTMRRANPSQSQSQSQPQLTTGINNSYDASSALLNSMAQMARKREREFDPLETVISSASTSNIIPAPVSAAIPALTSSTLYDRDQLHYAQMIAAAARLGPDVSLKKNACAPCHTAKTSCDGRRPCDRCVRLERAHLCVERERKIASTKKTNKKRKTGEEAKTEENKNNSKNSVNIKQEIEGENNSNNNNNIVPSQSDPKTDLSILPTDLPNPPIYVPGASASSTSSSSSSTSSNDSTTFNDVLVAADERELSKAMLRVMQSEQANVPHLLRQALAKRLVPPVAFQALLSYISNSMHPDDFAALMSSTNPGNPSPDLSDAYTIRLPDGSSMPRVLFTFRKSALDSIPDSERGVDFATITVHRQWPTDHKNNEAKKFSSTINNNNNLKSPNINNKEESQSSPRATSSPTSTTAPLTPAAVDAITPNTNNSQQPETPTQIKTEEETNINNSSSSASSRHPYFPAPVPGANFHDLSEVDLIIQVNREFERLFGYSQRDMRDLMMREGTKGLYRLYRPDSLYQIGRWLTEACLGHRTEFKAIVHLVNKFKGQTACVLSARFKLDDQGFFESVGYAYCPLPDNWQRQAERESAGGVN